MYSKSLHVCRPGGARLQRLHLLNQGDFEFQDGLGCMVRFFLKNTACFLTRDRKGMDLDRRGGGGGTLEELGEGKLKSEYNYMKNIYFK